MSITPDAPIKLYRYKLSGHSHRAQLMLALLKLEHELIDVDLGAKEQKTSRFLALNAFGQVPVIDDSGIIVADSNAILVYLATRYDNGTWLPRGAYGAAQVQRWLSVAAGPLAFGAAAARVNKVFGTPLDYNVAASRAHALFATMDRILAESPFLCGAAPTIADVSLYTYTAHAPEGDISLQNYPAVRTWIKRIQLLPGFVPMQAAAWCT